jgi:predicted nucleic acid-binding protein
VIVCDTSALIALIDADEQHHPAILQLFQQDPGLWLLPWAILPEVDYLLATRVGTRAQAAFLDDLVTGAYTVDWGRPEDLERAQTLSRRYADLRIGLTDGIVMATAERLRAQAIATLDLRHFGVVELANSPEILPRDAPLP